MINDIRTATITGKGQISIPKAQRKIKGFQVGDKVVVVSYEDRIELRPMVSITQKMEALMTDEEAESKGLHEE